MGDFEGLETLDEIMAFKAAKDELINCDKCGIPFTTKNKYRFYCEDCYNIMRMQEEIKTRNWSDKLVQKQWNQEAKNNRLSIMEKYGPKVCQQGNSQTIVE